MLKGGAPARRLAVLVSGSLPALTILYFALYGAYGSETPFFPAFLASRGLSPTEIGILLAAGTIVRIALGPLVGILADASGTRRVLAVAAIASGVLILVYLPRLTFWPLLAVSLLHSAATTPLAPLADALALTASTRESSFRYGWVRGIGSGSFVIGVLACGALVSRFGLGAIMVSSSVLFVMMAPPLLWLRPAPAAGAAIAKGSLPTLLRDRAFLLMLVVAALVIGSHALNDAFAVISWDRDGISSVTISLLWSAAVASEILVFCVVGPLLLERLPVGWCAAIAALAGLLRWSVLALSASVAVIAGTQLLHGLTFSLMHLTCMKVIEKTVPSHLMATGQMVYGTLALGLASTILTAVSGRLFAGVGQQAYWAMAALCLAAVPAGLRLRTPAQSRAAA